MGLVKPARDIFAPNLAVQTKVCAGFAELKALLQTGASAQRRQAVRDLAECPEGLALLCEHLEHETAASVRSVIITSLVENQSQVIVEGLIPYLSSEDSVVRNLTIEALQDMSDQVGPYMDILLRDPDSDVRIFAVNILSTLPNARAPQWLERTLREDMHVNVCAAAIDCLAEVGTPESAPTLQEVRLRFSNEPFIAFAVDAALRRIGSVG